MQGSYHVGNTASRPISEVKHRWALLVLTWETSLEPRVTLRFCTLFSANKLLAHARGPVILQATPHLNSRRIVLPRQPDESGTRSDMAKIGLHSAAHSLMMHSFVDSLQSNQSNLTCGMFIFICSVVLRNSGHCHCH
jgi:hypothetical protein